MRFLLYCNKDPRDLGIEDSRGAWDMLKFKEHVQECPDCQRFKVILGNDFPDDFTSVYASIQALKNGLKQC